MLCCVVLCCVVLCCVVLCCVVLCCVVLCCVVLCCVVCCVVLLCCVVLCCVVLCCVVLCCVVMALNRGHKSTRKPQRERKKSEIWGGRGGKNRENLGPLHRSGSTLQALTLWAPTLRPPFFNGFGPHPWTSHPSDPPTSRGAHLSGRPPLGAPTVRPKLAEIEHRQKSKKNKLAEVEIGRSRQLETEPSTCGEQTTYCVR